MMAAFSGGHFFLRHQLKQLLLFRHAKSAWPENVADFDRPLAPRGMKAAPKMAAFLADADLIPDVALVSSARRAQQSWSLAQSYFPGCVLQVLPDIYEADPETLMALIRAYGGAARKLMLLGHSPGLEGLALEVMRPNGGEDEQRLAAKFPTAGVAVFDLEIANWTEIS